MCNFIHTYRDFILKPLTFLALGSNGPVAELPVVVPVKSWSAEFAFEFTKNTAVVGTTVGRIGLMLSRVTA